MAIIVDGTKITNLLVDNNKTCRICYVVSEQEEITALVYVKNVQFAITFSSNVSAIGVDAQSGTKKTISIRASEINSATVKIQRNDEADKFYDDVTFNLKIWSNGYATSYNSNWGVMNTIGSVSETIFSLVLPKDNSSVTKTISLNRFQTQETTWSTGTAQRHLECVVRTRLSGSLSVSGFTKYIWDGDDYIELSNSNSVDQGALSTSASVSTILNKSVTSTSSSGIWSIN